MHKKTQIKTQAPAQIADAVMMLAMDATMSEQSEGKETYEFTDNLNDNLNDRTNSLEEMVKQDELLITISSSNLN